MNTYDQPTGGLTAGIVREYLYDRPSRWRRAGVGQVTHLSRRRVYNPATGTYVAPGSDSPATPSELTLRGTADTFRTTQERTLVPA